MMGRSCFGFGLTMISYFSGLCGILMSHYFLLCSRWTRVLCHLKVKTCCCCAFVETTDAFVSPLKDSGVLCIPNYKAEKGKAWMKCLNPSDLVNRAKITLHIYILILTSQSPTAPFSCIAPMDIVQPVVQPVDRQEHVSFHISTLNKHAKPESRQNSIPLNLSAYIQTRKQPDNPQPKAKGKQESTPSAAESKQGRGEIYISQSGPRHSGLGKSKQ